MLWCDSVAPLGCPVVPEVYWMLIGSSGESSACRAASARGSPGRPYTDVAAELGVTPGTLRTRVHYGLRRLRRVLETEETAA